MARREPSRRAPAAARAIEPPDTGREWVALAILERSNLKPGTDAFVFAAACRLRLHGRKRCGAKLHGRHAYYDATASFPEQQAMVLRCVAQWALRWCRERPTPAAVNTVMRVLLQGASEQPAAAELQAVRS